MRGAKTTGERAEEAEVGERKVVRKVEEEAPEEGRDESMSGWP